MRRVLITSFIFISLCVILIGCGQSTPTPPPPSPTPTSQPSPQATDTAEPADSEIAAATLTPSLTPTSPPPTIPPTPTPDPNLPAWTILVYMAGDNDLASAAWTNLNQMEAAGQSDEVQLIVQADLPTQNGQTGAVRYQISGDDNSQEINSAVLGELGELNMGDENTLSEFISWGVTTYPAQRYGLVMWNHGIGWNGVAFDDGAADQLTLPEMNRALQIGLGDETLDFVGFDACLMGQLDVYSMLAPFADTAVASEELTPVLGWPYTKWLDQLYADPDSNSQELAQTLVDQFMELYETELENDFVTLSAVDLQQIAAVETAVDDLAALLQEDLNFTASAIGNARSGAESFAQAYGVSADTYSAIDLHHFSQILAERALDESIASHATAVQEAIDAAVISSRHGSGLRQAAGIALYFPRNGRVYDANYAQNGTLADWNRFLEAYHAHGLGAAVPPRVELSPTSPDEPVGLANPAHLNFQIIGRDVTQVALFGGWYEYEIDANGAQVRSGRRLLLEYDSLIPEPTRLRDGSALYTWRDGLHEDFYIWSTQVTYLTDGESGQFVVMWPSIGSHRSHVDNSGEGQHHRTIQGTYTRTGTDDGLRANLVFDLSTGQITAVWATAAGTATPFELSPLVGDTFQADALYLNEDGSISTEAGVPLTIDINGQLSYEWRPIPSGDYFLGLEVENVAGDKSQATTDFVVNNDDASAQRGYLDPYLGFQFLYPAAWYRPTYQESALYTSDRAGDTRLQITIYDDASGLNALKLKQETLAQFGGVEILYEAPTVIDDRSGELTAYGYPSSAGDRTGQFVTFVRDGVGYVIDIDGPTTAEDNTVQTITTLLESWNYRPVGDGLFPNEWGRITLADFSVPQPEEFIYQPAEGGWERFIATEDAQIFVALRVDEREALPLPDVVAKWSAIAGNGVTAYEASEIGRFVLADQVWWRQDFAYTTDSGTEIWGFLLAQERDGQQIISWAEAPASLYTELEQTIFQVMLAELVKN